jgi:excinuclease ABC subunit A
MRHNIEVVVDRLTAGPTIRARLSEAVDIAIGVGKGSVIVSIREDKETRRTDNSVRPANVDLNDATDETDRNVRPTRKRRAAGVQPGDIVLSSEFACTECGLSFNEPTPQLFSFNSPQGMCLTCDGLGEFFSFDPGRLVASPEKSFEQGAIELVGAWNELGRWKRHIYRGVAETMERKLGLPEGTLLARPWRELTQKQRDIWLWGTGDTHITYTWRAGKAAQKYGGTFDGLIPELLEKYGKSKSTAQIRQLEQYMSVIRCPDCHGQRLNPQACAVTVTTSSEKFTDREQATLPGVLFIDIS